jgi:hypothetical protein
MANVSTKIASVAEVTSLPRYASFIVLVGVVAGWQSQGTRSQQARTVMAA